MALVIWILTVLVQLRTSRASRETLIALYLVIRISRNRVIQVRVADSPFSGVVYILHNRFLTLYEADGPGSSGW